MNKDEAAIEAAKHMGFYRKLSKEQFDRGHIARDEIDDLAQDMYLRCAKAMLTYDAAQSRPTTYLTMPCSAAARDFVTAKRRAAHPRLFAHKAREIEASMTGERRSVPHPAAIEPFLDYLGTQEREYVRRRARGDTYQQIAAACGVTHQRVHGVLQAAYQAIRAGRRSNVRSIEDGTLVHSPASQSPSARHCKAYRTRQAGLGIAA